MSEIRLGDYCCQGGDKVVDTNNLSATSLDLKINGNRTLRFSPLGNGPVAPKIALVGITPGSQSEVFAKLLRTLPVEEAAKRAAFESGQSQIKELLAAHGFAASLGIDLAGDLNDNPAIFTTSLVKCCLLVDGSYKYKAPDIAASPEASFCVQNRFIQDILRFASLKWVVIFGDPGWEAVNTLRYEGKTIKAWLTSNGVNVVNFPHFAQNFQQRAIYCLPLVEEETYLAAKPKHRPYALKARKMRDAVIYAMSLRENAAGLDV